ncbi:MAG: discoidin domain-containing protein [Phycisphaerae bacterium]
MARMIPAAAFSLLLLASLPAPAQVCNLKVVTDANPDYSDMPSMIHSITSKWEADKDKAWAVFYWNHIARRQTSPMILHGMELTDPIRQFNDYGYTMCSTISGNNCSIFDAMGWPVKFWDISNHTVMEVKYDGKFHMHDNSLSALYTTCDGKTLAGVAEIGAEGACEASGGKKEPGHIAKYHCLYSTSRNGYLQGADCMRALDEEYRCFNPNGLKLRTYYNNWDRGHRWIFNLRDNEVYTRYYHRMDADSPNKVKQGKSDYTADPAYYVPNNGWDPETPNVRYHIRGNGVWKWRLPLTADQYKKAVISESNIAPAAGGGLMAVDTLKDAEVVFGVNAANVICSQTVELNASGKVSLAVSVNNGKDWKDVDLTAGEGGIQTAKMIEQINGAYQVLLKVHLAAGKVEGSPSGGAMVKSVDVETITQVNSKTQPRLKLGRNTVYVGAGEQTESIVYWPELQNGKYKQFAIEEQNVKTAPKHPEYLGAMFSAAPNEDSYVVFRMDAPRDFTKVSYGGRFYNRAPGSHIDLLHSFDGGKTWTKSWSLTSTEQPWDVIHYETIADVPAGAKSVLFKYLWSSSAAGADACSVYAVRMEGDYKPADAAPKPVEVTFTWKEPQAQYGQFVTRSHTQLVEKLPARYTIDVGGEDHPVMESLQVNLKGAVEATAAKPVTVKYGYSDGKEIPDAKKFVDRWVTIGKILSEGKPYTCSIPSGDNWGANDAGGKRLTDGIVGPPYAGGAAMMTGPIWLDKQEPVITVDLGKAESCGAFRIQIHGYPWWDAIKGEVKDKVEVLTSNDGQTFASQGFFNFDLRWKNIPANHMWTDEETFCAHNHELILPKPVEARYVRFKVTCARFTSISEVQVLDFIKYDPFDLRIALPDEKPEPKK